MSHPARFRDDDPYLRHLRAICRAFPQAAEKNSHGRPVFFTRKTFAMFGATVPGDHWDPRWARSVVTLPDADDRAALLTDARFFVPAYWGPSGWVGLDLSGRPASNVDWTEVAELVDASFRNTATVTLVRELDARSG